MYTGKYVLDEEVTIKSTEELIEAGKTNRHLLTAKGEPIIYEGFRECTGKVIDRGLGQYDYLLMIPTIGYIAVYEEELLDNAPRIEKSGRQTNYDLTLGKLIEYVQGQYNWYGPNMLEEMANLPIEWRGVSGALETAVATLEDGKLIIGASTEEEPKSYKDTVVGNLLIAEDGREGTIIQTGYDADANIQYYVVSPKEAGTFTIYESEVKSIDF